MFLKPLERRLFFFCWQTSAEKAVRLPAISSGGSLLPTVSHSWTESVHNVIDSQESEKYLPSLVDLPNSTLSVFYDDHHSSGNISSRDHEGLSHKSRLTEARLCTPRKGSVYFFSQPPRPQTSRQDSQLLSPWPEGDPRDSHNRRRQHLLLRRNVEERVSLSATKLNTVEDLQWNLLCFGNKVCAVTNDFSW